MRDNIIINLDPNDKDYHEAKGENCAALSTSFFRTKLGIRDVYVASSHRLGAPNAGKTRAIIARQ